MRRSRWSCRRALKVGSTAEFVALARAQPGQLNWAATTGLPLYIVAALQKSANIDITQISYRDFGPAFQDFATGRVHLLATGITGLLPQVNAGRGKFLFVPNRERSPLAPDVPTAVEAGFPDLTFDAVNGIYGWRDMPAALKDRIAADVRAIAADPAVAERLKPTGAVMRPRHRCRIQRRNRAAARAGRSGGADAGGQAEVANVSPQKLRLSLGLKIRGFEQLGAAVEIGREELPKRLRGFLRGLDAERVETAFRAQRLHRLVDPAVDRPGEIGRHVRRTPHRPPGADIELRQADLRHGRNFRRKLAALGAGHGDGADAAGAHHRQQRQDRLDHQRHVAADDVVRRRRGAAIGDDRHVGAGVLIERHLREMAGRAELRGRERPLPWGRSWPRRRSRSASSPAGCWRR